MERCLCVMYQEQYGVEKDKCINIISLVLLENHQETLIGSMLEESKSQFKF